MWRFLEEGPMLKFPLRESPFMSADPMVREFIPAPPLRFKKHFNEPKNSHMSFFSSSPGSDVLGSQKKNRTESSSTTVGVTGMDDIPSIPKSRNSKPTLSSPSSLIM